MGSGKSTFAYHLERRAGFQRLLFAGPLKAMTATMFNCAGFSPEDTAELMTDRELKEAPVSSYPAIHIASMGA